MMSLLAAVLFLLLASSNASKYFHPLHHFLQDKEPYSDTSEGNEGDSESLLAKLAAKLRSEVDEDGWEGLPDPRMYVLTELESPGGTSNLQELYQDGPRAKRQKVKPDQKTSLSISDNLDVLHQRYLLALFRKSKENQKEQIGRNNKLLEILGKRSYKRAVDAERGSESNEQISRSRSYFT